MGSGNMFCAGRTDKFCLSKHFFKTDQSIINRVMGEWWRDKYEQIVNKQKKRRKMLVFRIFRQILAKMDPQSQYLCGFPRGTVEMA